MIKRMVLPGIIAALVILAVRITWHQTMLRSYKPEWLVGILAVLFISGGVVLAGWMKKYPLHKQVPAPSGKPESPEQHARHFGLSEAEMEVWLLLEKGLTNAEIAEKRHVSVNTVKTQISSLYEKLGVDNRVKAVALLRDRNHPLE